MFTLVRKCINKLYNIYYCRKFSNIGCRCGFGGIKTLVGTKNIEIGDDCCFGHDLFLTAWINGNIKIHNKCTFGAYNHISASNQITIGEGILTGK